MLAFLHHEDNQEDRLSRDDRLGVSGTNMIDRSASAAVTRPHRKKHCTENMGHTRRGGPDKQLFSQCSAHEIATSTLRDCYAISFAVF